MKTSRSRDDTTRIKALYDSYDLPDTPGGFVAAVIRSGNVVFKQAYGFANYEHQIHLSTSSIIDFASMAKQFTGFAIATLAQDCKLGVDDDVHDYLPELPDFGNKITLKHLLHHTNGIRDWVGLVKIAGRDDSDVISNDFLMKLVANQRELNFVPGESFQYSNTGYLLLAHVVAKVTRQSFTQWTREHIFQPLGMNDTHFCEDHREIVFNRANAYKQNERGQYVNTSNQLESSGSSSLFSTLDDMIKWMSNYETNALGGDKIWRMMCQSGTLNNGKEIDYGFGISLEHDQGLERIGHGGSWAGFQCQLSYYPAHQITTILAINRDPAGFTVDTSEIIRILLDSAESGRTNHSSAPEPSEVAIEPGQLANYTGPYQSSSGMMWVERVDDQLIISSPSGLRILIYPEGQDRFFGRGFDVQFSFLRGADGVVDRLVYYVSGIESQPLEKLNENALEFHDLDDFCGDYHCPELRTTYTAVIKDHRLVLEHLHNEDVILQQVAQDNYQGNKWWCTEIRIIRNTQNQICGFKLNGDSDNIQNLLFIKETLE